MHRRVPAGTGSGITPVPSAEARLRQASRYDDQIGVFGGDMQARLAAARAFLVGAGALGCEFIKNFACMGLATAERGLVTLTDDDTIEKSNLSRQFLFRDRDIGRRAHCPPPDSFAPHLAPGRGGLRASWTPHPVVPFSCYRSLFDSHRGCAEQSDTLC